MLGPDFRRVQYFFIARLSLDVVGHRPFARRVSQREAPESVFSGKRRNCVFTSRRSWTPCSSRSTVLALALEREPILNIRHLGHVIAYPQLTLLSPDLHRDSVVAECYEFGMTKG